MEQINIYFGEKMYKPTIGNKIKDLGKEHIIDTIKLMYGSMLCLVIICVVYELLAIVKYLWR